MAFAIYASVGDTTTQLNDENPFRVESIEGLSNSGIVRYEQRGPLQQGATDLGFRLRARMLTLNLLFYAATDALLDTYRDTLMATFKPLQDVSIFLSMRRDDDEIRTLTCHTVGDIAIDLVPEHKAAKLHRARVQLRAANPLLKANAVTSGTVDFSALGQWWLAGGAIGSARTHVEYPPPAGGGLAFSGTITGDWSVVVVTARGTPTPGTEYFVWQDGTGGSASFHSRTTGTAFAITDNGLGHPNVAWPGPTDYNYHVVESRGGTQMWRYWNNGTLTLWTNTVDAGTATYDYSLRGGSLFSWRANRIDSSHDWVPELRKAAIYQDVSTAQLQALGPYLFNNIPGTITLVNDGDVDAYPLIVLRGPLADPVIVNTTTNGTLNLTGGTLAATDTWTIDLRDGDKRIYNQNGLNVMGSIASFPITMASFVLPPAPIAAGGTNVLVLTPGSAGSAAYFAAEITNQYLSF